MVLEGNGCDVKILNLGDGNIKNKKSRRVTPAII